MVLFGHGGGAARAAANRRSRLRTMALTKKDVLSKVNEVLVVAGLNDNVWSIRDCDSMLFGLMYKKLFGKLPGVNPSPASAAG